MAKRLLILLFAGLSAAQGNDGLHTETYLVPPNFFDRVKGPDHSTGHTTYRKTLETAGIVFPEGATVQFDPASLRLDLHAGPEQQKQIREIIQQMVIAASRFVSVQFEEYTLSKEDIAKLGFEWLEPRHYQMDFHTPGVRIMDSEASLADELRKKPVPTDESTTVVSKGITGVFSGSQPEPLKKKFSEVGLTPRTPPVAVTESGRPVVVQDGTARWAVISTLSGDEIDLSLFLPPHGEALFAPGDAIRPSTRVTLSDGQTVAWSEKQKTAICASFSPLLASWIVVELPSLKLNRNHEVRSLLRGNDKIRNDAFAFTLVCIRAAGPFGHGPR